MFARVSALILALTLLAPAAGAQFGRAQRLQPVLNDLQRILETRGMTAPVDIVSHRCERRPSALYGPDTYRCSVMLTGGSEVLLVISAFDGRWAVTGR